MFLRASFLAVLLGCSVFGQRAWWDEVAFWKAPTDEQPIAPEVACGSLRALTGFEYSIISAVLLPASDGFPEYCHVTGLIQPEIKFEVALPTSWHGRLLMWGNGGYAGEAFDRPDWIRRRGASLAAGFAVTQTNTGHDAEGEPLGAFATNPQKLLDYSFRAVHVTAETAKKISAAYYGAAPKRSYFYGCSTGGRQALISAQRFPADFDGIVAGAPVLDFVSTMLNYVPLRQALAKAPVTTEDLKRAGAVIYSLCDEKDGVKDGVIDDPGQCDFKPSVHLPKCGAGDSEGCFNEGQIAVLERLYSDQSIAGKRVFPAWPVGPEVAGADGRPGWNRWLVREDAAPLFETFSEAFFRYLALPEKQPNLQLHDVDVESIAPNLDWIRRLLNATDTDLSAFRDRGGKLLMWFGWADPALNPRMGVEYYESVVREMGPGTGEFFRLFMMPGVFHCAGGPGCDSAPRLAALIDWVERGHVPDTITASRVTSGNVVRTRPLCPYPQVGKYKGIGDPNQASSFACSAPGGR